MSKNSAVYDVFMSYNMQDRELAGEISRSLEKMGLNPFDPASALTLAADWSDGIRQAIAECHAVILVTSDAPPSPNVALELGAAMAWNKPVYVIAKTHSVKLPYALLKDAQVLPVSRLDEVAKAIQAAAQPLSETEVRRLGELYRKAGLPVDQLALQPDDLAKLVNRFNQGRTTKMSGEEVMSQLVRLRKRRALPTLGN